MIDGKIFAMGATSISVEVAKWKSDGKTPALFRCKIETAEGGPSAFVAERDTHLQAERECVEAFTAYFGARTSKLHPHTISLREKVEPAGPSKVKAAIRRKDDFEY